VLHHTAHTQYSVQHCTLYSIQCVALYTAHTVQCAVLHNTQVRRQHSSDGKTGGHCDTWGRAALHTVPALCSKVRSAALHTTCTVCSTTLHTTCAVCSADCPCSVQLSPSGVCLLYWPAGGGSSPGGDSQLPGPCHHGTGGERILPRDCHDCHNCHSGGDCHCLTRHWTLSTGRPAAPPSLPQHC